MGIIKDLKRIFFGASAITKSATEKAGEFIKEEGSELLEKSKEFAADSGKTISKKTTGLKDAILESSEDLIQQTKDKLIDIGDDIKDNPVSQEIKDKGNKILDKAGEITEKVGSKVIDKSEDLLDKGKDLSESVGEKVISASEVLKQKAGEVSEQIGEKLGETMEKAEAWEAEQKANPKPDFAEETLDADGSLLEGTDDFFSKADKYATGDYGAFSEGKITIDTKKTEKDIIDASELPKATGFEDGDGDGNEIIDDAIIEE